MSIPTGERGLQPQHQPLGAPIKPAPTPAPAPKQIKPGIIQGTDGKLSTHIPPPAAAIPACSSCIDVATPSLHEPCRSCAFPGRPLWWPAARGARP